jgi:hypothetical protein
MQTTTRRFDFGIAGALISCPLLSGCFRVFGDIETYNGAGDTGRGRLAERNQCCKSQDCSSHHRDPRDINAATSNASLDSARHWSWDEGARTTLVRKKWHPSSSAVQSLAGSTGEKFGPNVYKLSIETHQMMH